MLGELARGGKHQAFLLTRRARKASVTVQDRLWHTPLAARRRPFDAAAYLEADGQPALEYFLGRGPQVPAPSGEVPRRIFVAWTDDNPLTPNREAHLESIRMSNPSVDVVLVTPATLAEWVIPESPLNPVYPHLSAVHRSDYLRAYLLHHHGGGWSDIKRTTQDWSPMFDAMDADPNAWLMGYPEASSKDVMYLNSAIGRELRHRYASIAANCAFIARAHSPFTAQWLDEVESRLDYYRRELERHPAQDPFGETGGYPLPWAVLQGAVFQPLQIKYVDHVRLDERLRPDVRNNR